MVERITKWKLSIINLYRTGYHASFHIREMAKILKTSHVTLLLHLNDLEKEQILTAKSVGKNKVFSLNLSNIAAREYVVLAEKAETLAFLERVFFFKKLISELANFHGCFVVFGSYAKATFTKESDIDLFYIGELAIQETKMIEQFGKLYGKKISLKKSTVKNFEEGLQKKDPLIREIIKDHYILQNADMFVNAVWRYYHEITES